MEISVVIPARDEERYIGRCLDSLRQAAARAGIALQLIVVLNRCTDRTEELAKAAGAECVYEDAKNLSVIRNAGARAAKGELLITIDADSRVSASMLQRICELMRDGSYVGGGVIMFPERWSLGILLTGLCLLPFVIFERIAAGLFFCRRCDFESLGGFDERLVSVEDVDFARRLKALGRERNQRFAIIRSAYIITSCRKFDALGDWYFLRHPQLFRRMFQGRDQALADRIWYDFPREPDQPDRK